MEILSTLVLATIIGSITAFLASKRGRNPFVWLFVGILFGMLGLLFLFILPSCLEEESEEGESLILGEGSQKEPKEEAYYQKKEWFYLNEKHEQEGGVSFDELRKNWIEGKLSDWTYVWAEGMGEWKKIAEMSELKKELNT